MYTTRRISLRGSLIILGLGFLVLPCAPAMAADVVVTGHALSDNGDDDGYADTNETVELRITVRNMRDAALTGITARLEIDDPKIECIVQHAVYVGDLATGETRFIPGAFAFKVGDVNRSDPYEVFTAALRVVMSSPATGELEVLPEELILELDLDATGGSGPGDYFEGFEAGNFGTLAAMNLDAGKHSLEASDGYRCQYSDPDWAGSNSYGQITDCWLGATALQADAFFWQVVDGQAGDYHERSFTGRYSVWMGALEDDYLGGWHATTPMGNLEGLGSGPPVNLGAGRVCETTRTIACSDEMDCPPGENCAGVASELSFKYQISLADYRCVSVSYPDRSANGGAVALQLADEAGNPVGSWIKLYAYTNVYDEMREDNYTNCYFDPTDDGNTEDDFFDPSDPERRLGPSTLCYPEFVYAYMGDTDAPFDPAEIGHAEEGSGLEGETGLGTWVESRFNLQEFRGRRIRLRFVSGGIKAGTAETFEDLFKWNPIACDDGWWIDDIRITDTLAVPAVLSVDVKDNSGLPAVVDADTDGYCDSDCDDGDPACTVDCSDADSDGQRICNGDCDEANPIVYLGAEEVCDGVSNDCAHPQWPYVDYWAHATVAEPPRGAASVFAADLDGDGDIDVLSAEYDEDRIAWHENVAGDGSAWVTHTITTSVDGASAVCAADLDGDEDMDVLAAAREGDTVTWYENVAGDGSDWSEGVVTTGALGARGVEAADVDGDDDLDVIVAAYDTAGRLRWYENVAGDGSDWTGSAVGDVSSLVEAHGGDIDGDEDVDLVVTSTLRATWWENRRGDGSQWFSHGVDLDHYVTVAAVADLDSDGDADLLVADKPYGRVAWQENAAGDGSTWTWHLIAESGLWDHPMRVHAADVDGDGDIDALTASELTDEVTWYENAAGDGSTWVVRPISWSAEEAVAVCTGHINDDGDLDVLSADANEVTWYSRGNLELDDDGDGVADCEGDCDDTDLTVWGIPGEVQDLTLLEDRQTLTWSAPADPGGTSLLYDTLRVDLPDDFAGATCIESGDGSDTEAVDGDPIASGAIYYYLVVATNSCGRGCAGFDSDDDEREVCACP